MYISTREMVISIICNACGVLGLILWAIEAHKSNANQRIQDVESVEPMQTETQTETENSNLTFENRTMLDCYNCKQYKSDDACVECRYEPRANTPQTERSACDTCQWYNSGIPCGVEPSVCKREITDTPQTDCGWGKPDE